MVQHHGQVSLFELGPWGSNLKWLKENGGSPALPFPHTPTPAYLRIDQKETDRDLFNPQRNSEEGKSMVD
jgi:hypothetical protein